MKKTLLLVFLSLPVIKTTAQAHFDIRKTYWRRGGGLLIPWEAAKC